MELKKRLLFLYNPFAGRCELVGKLHEVINLFVKHHYSVTVHPTQCDEDAYQQTKSIGKKFDYLVCSGGDGTLNEVIRGLMELPVSERPLLGYLPSGSTNDFASSMKIPTDLLKAAELVVSGVPTSIDIGQLESRYFAYVAAFGLFADVTYDTDQGLKNLFGHSAYMLEGVKRLTNIKTIPCRIICGDEEWQDEFIFGMMTNSATVGGFHIPRTDDKRQFLLILLRQVKDLADFSGVIAALAGLADPGPQFIIQPVSDVQIISHNPIPWTVDGEYGGQYTKNHLQVFKKAISIIL